MLATGTSATNRKASPGRKAGCGLKQHAAEQAIIGALRITRPKGRVRIETLIAMASPIATSASPGRKAGCGLKQ